MSLSLPQLNTLIIFCMSVGAFLYSGFQLSPWMVARRAAASAHAMRATLSSAFHESPPDSPQVSPANSSMSATGRREHIALLKDPKQLSPRPTASGLSERETNHHNDDGM
jgi:hypothetical protein